jgi:uncharacterized protein (DUF305 family)
MHEKPYARLTLMVGLSFAAMYVLMYAMVNAFENVFHNVNQAYMAGLMAAPMAMIELALMRNMYPDRRVNALVLAGSLVLLIGCWLLIRNQIGVADRQFLRSMIPHHAGAILMCREATIRDPQITDLCRRIIASQEAEIAEMKADLQRLSDGAP